MKRLLATLLAAACLAGCSAQGSSSAQRATLPAAPEAEPQSLTVYCDLPEGSAGRAALNAYAEAQNVTVEFVSGEEGLASADLALLAAQPADAEGWTDLTGDSLLKAAAARAGLPGEGEEGVTALPLGRTLYAYWADSTVLTALLGEDCLTDLQNASWSEWSDFAETMTAWIEAPSETKVTLNGNSYTLPAEAPEAAAGLEGVFAMGGADQVSCLGGALFTNVLLAAGSEYTDKTLTGPLNGLYSAVVLEAENTAGDASRTMQDAAGALGSGTALLYRGLLADVVAVVGSDRAQTLVPLPVKCQLEDSDLTTEEYNLSGLMNYPTLACAGYLAIPDNGSADQKAAASAILWLYGSGDGNTRLTDDLYLVTPWNTASDSTTLGALQVQLVSTGILPEVALNGTRSADLAKACADVVAAETRSTATRTAFVEAVLAGLDVA